MTEHDERPVPRADDAERTVIGAILVDPQAFFDVAGMLSAEYFHIDRHRRMFAAIQALAKANKPIDSVTVHASIGAKEISWMDVDSLTNGMPRRTNVGYHAGLVLNAWKLRETVKRAGELVAAATQPAAQAADVLEQGQAALFTLAGESRRKTFWHAEEMTAGLVSDLDGEDVPGNPIAPPVSVGLPNVDALFEGFAGGDLAFIGGRPGTGKTSLAQQIGLYAAQDRMVLSVVMEMRHQAMWRRALANVTGVRIPTHRRRKFTEYEYGRIYGGLERLGRLKMAIEDCPNASDMQVLATARRVQMQYGLGLIIVDYLQLMRSDTKHRSRGEELGAITRSLKQIAMQLDVPIVVLAALSRDAASGRPNMAHIRECGTAEYDADHIFLMHRDVEEQKELEPGQPSRAELIVEKQRNGGTGAIPLVYYGDTYRFESEAVA